MPRRWPLSRIILAYTIMTLLAFSAVWIVDRKVHLLPTSQPTNSAAPPVSE